MKELHDRINRVINAGAFLRTLESNGVDLIDFQCSWAQESEGDFNKLPPVYRKAIEAGEAELSDPEPKLVLAA